MNDEPVIVGPQLEFARRARGLALSHRTTRVDGDRVQASGALALAAQLRPDVDGLSCLDARRVHARAERDGLRAPGVSRRARDRVLALVAVNTEDCEGPCRVSL